MQLDSSGKEHQDEPIHPTVIVKTDKEKSTERIDGAAATIMALDNAVPCGKGGGTSVYNDSGLFIL